MVNSRGLMNESHDCINMRLKGLLCWQRLCLYTNAVVAYLCNTPFIESVFKMYDKRIREIGKIMKILRSKE